MSCCVLLVEDDELFAVAMDIGADGYLVKPFEAGELP